MYCMRSCFCEISSIIVIIIFIKKFLCLLKVSQDKIIGLLKGSTCDRFLFEIA